MDFNFKSLKLDLGLQPQNLRIDGAAQYRLSANITGADTLILFAGGLSISSVSLDSIAVKYDLKHDSLLIRLKEPSQKGQSYQLRIRYSGAPKFGLLKDHNGTVWSSQLPKAQRHWVPGFDNPRVSLKTTFNISVPSGFQVWASGKKTGEDVVSVDVVTYHFKSQKELPASSLSLNIGKFTTKSVTDSGKQINLITEKQLSENIGGQNLLQSAQKYITQIEKQLGAEYPFEELNIFVLDDHEWEAKNWAASAVYVYKNGGNLKHQLLRGIAAQWFGVNKRESQWAQADAVTLYQQLLSKAVSDSVPALNVKDVPATDISTIYDNYSAKRWNRWRLALQNWQDKPQEAVIANTAKEVFGSVPNVIQWNDIAEYWYRKSGQPYFNGFELPIIRTQSANQGQKSDSVIYNVRYSMDEAPNARAKLKLVFEAKNKGYKKLTTLKSTEVYPDKKENGKVSFKGKRDSVILNVSPLISTFRLLAAGHPKLKLDEYKPASFLIYEVRNAKTTEQRAEAAGKLGLHKDNPDIQFAIKDFMKDETNPKVKAALLRSLGDIMQGAAGTEQTFIDALNSNSPLIRRAAFQSLGHYKGNPEVEERLRKITLQTGSLNDFKESVDVMAKAVSDSAFNQFASRVIASDSVGLKSLYIAKKMAKRGQTSASVKRAESFLNDNYRFDIRKSALDILASYDQTPADWLSRTKKLMQDADPRMRFIFVNALEKHLSGDIKSYLKNNLEHEEDARVFYKIKSIL